MGLLLSPSDREEMLKEKYTWDEVYKLLNRGGLPGDMQPNMKKKTEDPAYIFEQHRLRTRKSVPLMEAVQRRIDRAAQAVSETCLDGAETKRVEAVRMSGGEDRSALERKRILLDLSVRCLAPKGVDPVTGGAPDGEVAKYFGKSREYLDGNARFSDEVYRTLTVWRKLAIASEKTDYMLTEV